MAAFGLTEVLQCSSMLRHLGEGCSSMEEAARAVVRFLYGNLVQKETGGPALSLVRLYKTHPYDRLEPEVQAIADRVAGRGQPPVGRLHGSAPCLTLLASAGEESGWNDRRESKSHQAIPVSSAAAIESSPMVLQLVRQLGLDLSEVVLPDPSLFRQNAGRPCGVFYVPVAEGSDHVPAQDFVARYRIMSVLGFGGVLPSGFVYAVVMFSKVEIPAATADVFSSLSFAAQLALLPFVERRVFDSEPAANDSTRPFELDLRVTRAEAAALGHLLDARQDVVIDQSLRLEQALHDMEDRASALALAQHRLVESEARKTAIIDAALDCIITMGSDGCIIEFNPAAEKTFGYSREYALGRSLADLIIPPRFREHHRAGMQRYLDTGDGPILGRRIEVVAVRADNVEFPAELTVVPVKAEGVGLFSGHVRDISERVQAETELREAGERSARVARTLQASLLPPTLPVIPGIEIASLYRPATEGLDVGGDFYDVFEIGRDDWGLVLGDVMGKGTEAAALTALARYSVRAAAIRVRRPVAVLTMVNEAINRHDPSRFCTAVYARLRVGHRTHMTLGSGGHLPALLRRSNDVQLLATQGPLLGPFARWTGSERRVTLHPGDFVLFYSDGVTEARDGSRFFGTERLVQLLTDHRDLDARETVALVGAAVTAFTAHPTDDVAILGLRVQPEAAQPPV